MTRVCSASSPSRGRALRPVGALVTCLLGLFSTGPAASASPPGRSSPGSPAAAHDRRFVREVRAQMPVLHEDITDGFPLQRLETVLAYRSQTSRTQPKRTCRRSAGARDDTPCPAGATADLAAIGFASKVDHIDYPAPFDTVAQAELAATAPADRAMYYFAKRDPLRRRSFAYWFFYSYNYFVATLGAGAVATSNEVDRHEGDLEHVVAYTDAARAPVAYSFFVHSTHRDYAVDDPRLQRDGRRDHVLGFARHVRVYAGHGSHASETGCGLFNLGAVLFGLHDRTCAVDPTTDQTATATATASFTPTHTRLVNLDLASWACFPGRLGASDVNGFDPGLAPRSPLVQSADCPNLAARRRTSARVPGDFVPSGDAFAGIDRCADWEQSSLSPGFILVVCNQAALTNHLVHRVSTRSGTTIRITGPTASPTAKDVPAYVLEPNAAALGTQTISASSTRPVDVYVAETSADAGGVRDVLFPGVQLSGPLHVSAEGSTWTLSDANGLVIASQTPSTTGCPLAASLTTVGGLLTRPCGTLGAASGIGGGPG